MRLTKISLAAACAVLFCAAAQAKPSAGYTSRAVENLPAFSAVDVRGDAEVDFVQGENPSVTLSGRESAVSAAQVRVEKGTLIVSFSKKMFRGKDEPRILVTAPALQAVAVSQNGEFDVLGPLQAKSLTLSASQNGEISIDDLETGVLTVTVSDKADADVNRLAAERVRAVASGRGDIELAGMAQEASFENNGSGEIDAGDLRVQTAQAVVNGSGDVEVFASQTLSASAMGSGKIKYKGVPARINPAGNTRKIVQD